MQSQSKSILLSCIGRSGYRYNPLNVHRHPLPVYGDIQSTKGYQISLERIKNTLLESLRAGQILQARALDSTHDKQIQLRIGRLDILAATQARIEAGENLTLQVIKNQSLAIERLSRRSAPAIFKLKQCAPRWRNSPPFTIDEHLNTLTPMRTGTHPEPLMQQLKQPVQASPWFPEK